MPPTLLGLDNEPGWLEGHGDLPAALARQLAIHPASLQRLLAHPLTGELLDLTPEVRVPSAALDRYVRARDGICAGPACGAGTRNADLDHITPVAAGGKTIRANMHALCRRSHRSRHAGGYQVTRQPGGAETWTDPHGNSYATHPTRYPVGNPDPVRNLADRPGGETDGSRGGGAHHRPRPPHNADIGLPPRTVTPGRRNTQPHRRWPHQNTRPTPAPTARRRADVDDLALEVAPPTPAARPMAPTPRPDPPCPF